MQLTEINMKLVEPPSPEGVVAYVHIVFEDVFAVKDLKLISGSRGIMLCMPSRPKTDRCSCGSKMAVIHEHCGRCGSRRKEPCRLSRKDQFVDVSHPVRSEYRKYLEREITDEYHRLLEVRNAE